MEMIIKKAEYKVKSDNLDEALNIVRSFVRTVDQEEPGVVKYDAFQHKDDPQTFTHFMVFTDESADETHQNAEHTKKFVENLYPKCENEPEYTELISADPQIND